MQWIERYRLEISVGKASEDINKQLRTLNGKDKKALRSEFKGWLKGSHKVDIDELTFIDHHNYW